MATTNISLPKVTDVRPVSRGDGDHNCNCDGESEVSSFHVKEQIGKEIQTLGKNKSCYSIALLLC
jgi:hypothetical protein